MSHAAALMFLSLLALWPLWARNDYDQRTIDQLTSTLHQPANACFAPSLLPNVGETWPTANMENAQNQRVAS